MTGKGNMMKSSKTEQYGKITQVFPDVGECGINRSIDSDPEKLAGEIKSTRGWIENR
jgi:hypothetical protein